MENEIHFPFPMAASSSLGMESDEQEQQISSKLKHSPKPEPEQFEDDPDSRQEEDGPANPNVGNGKEKGRMRKRKNTDLDLSKLSSVAQKAQQLEKERLQRLQTHKKDLDSSIYAPVLVKSNGIGPDEDILLCDEVDLEQEEDEDELFIEKVVQRKPIALVEVSSDEEATCGTSSAAMPNASAPNAMQSHQLARLHIRKRRLSDDYDKLEKTAEGRLLINAGKPEGDPEVFVAPHLTDVLQPHQIGGVRFMYDNVIESLMGFDRSEGFGCILAHTMGLGKTIQAITFVEIFIRVTKKKRVLIICPVNVLQNWNNEFEKWMPRVHPSTGELIRSWDVFLLGDALKSFQARAELINEWDEKGGVLLMGYEMFRLLVAKDAINGTKLVRKRTNRAVQEQMTVLDLDRDLANLGDQERQQIVQKAAIRTSLKGALLNPGPDLIICDEGHRIKNLNTDVSAALSGVQTRRRIVLTGYPLQNNLMEYYCMVQFVRPAYLGTRKDFLAQFDKPIRAGQCIDSSRTEMKLAKQRIHVLTQLLRGFVQRRSQHLLKKILPESKEFVLLLRKSPIQHALYRAFYNYARAEVNSCEGSFNPLKAFAICMKIANHPDMLFCAVLKAQQKRKEKLMVNKEIEDQLPEPPVEEISFSNVATESAPDTAIGNNSNFFGGNGIGEGRTNNEWTSAPNGSENQGHWNRPMGSSASDLTAFLKSEPVPLAQCQSQPYLPPPPFFHLQQQYKYDYFANANPPQQNDQQRHWPRYGIPPPPAQQQQYYTGGWPTAGAIAANQAFAYPQPPMERQFFPPMPPLSSSQTTQNQQQSPSLNNFGQGQFPPQYGQPRPFSGGGTIFPSSSPFQPSAEQYSQQQSQQQMQLGQGPGQQPLQQQHFLNAYLGDGNGPAAINSSGSASGGPFLQYYPRPQQTPQQTRQFFTQPQHHSQRMTNHSVAAPYENIPDPKNGWNGPQYQQNNAFINNQNNMFGGEREMEGMDLWQKQQSREKSGENLEMGMSNDGLTVGQRKQEMPTEKSVESEPKKEGSGNGRKRATAKEVLSDLLSDEFLLDDATVSLEWAEPLLRDYQTGQLDNSPKLFLAMQIIVETVNRGEKMLLFSQSVVTLNLIEDFLRNQTAFDRDGKEFEFIRNKTYCRFDGSTSSSDREKLIRRFNEEDQLKLFLISTRAGSLGVNLVSASRVIIFDVSWNPCHDAQAICRIYRYGQKRRTFVYRLIMANSMEKQVFNRQISKQGLQKRVIDEQSIDANVTTREVENLMDYNEALDVLVESSYTAGMKQDGGLHVLDDDDLLAQMMHKYGHWLMEAPFLHESLMLEREEGLSQEEKLEAELLFAREKDGYSGSEPAAGTRGPDTNKGERTLVPNLPFSQRFPFNFNDHLSHSTPLPKHLYMANGGNVQQQFPVPMMSNQMQQPQQQYPPPHPMVPPMPIRVLTIREQLTLPKIRGPGESSTYTLRPGQQVSSIVSSQGYVYLRTQEGVIVDATNSPYGTGLRPRQDGLAGNTSSLFGRKPPQPGEIIQIDD